MYIQMWLVVLLVLFSALGVWALIFAIGIIGKLIDIAFRGYKPKGKADNGNPAV